MSTAVLTPYTTDLAADVPGRLWRKQLLPVGSISYKGRKLDFTRDYLKSLAESFKNRAYDSVKFLLAPPDNTHTMDPERMRGTLRDVELADDGLYGYLDLSDDAQQLIKDHPDLGVSVQIIEGLQRADGKSFPRAIRHVLGTLDPRVTGMRPWEAVNLSNDSEDMATVDLTDAEFHTEKGATVADMLTDEELTKLRELLNKPTEPAAPATEATTTEPDEDAEFQAALAEIIANEQGEPVGAELSADAQQAIDLAVAQADQARQTADTLAVELAKERAKAERAAYIAAGVPPADVDLAMQILELPQNAVVELSNDERLDASEIVRNLLSARKGTVDLSAATGDAYGDERGDEAEKYLEMWEKQYPAKH